MRLKYLYLKIFLIITLNTFISSIGSGQVALLLIIFGDKLATEDLHLSIDGAINMSGISNIESKGPYLGANFGFGLLVKISER